MRIDDGYGSMMSMPHGSMMLWVLPGVLLVLAVGYGLGYAVERN